MNWKIWSLKKSPWVFHVNVGACNNCDIEIVNCLTPKFDVERFGIKLVGSPRHADALLVTGVGTCQAVSGFVRCIARLRSPVWFFLSAPVRAAQAYSIKDTTSKDPLIK